MKVYAAKRDKIIQAIAQGIMDGFGLKKTEFEAYKVRVIANILNIRSGPGTSYKVAGQIRDRGVYTIVEKNNGWGKLKSGAGWISLRYTENVK